MTKSHVTEKYLTSLPPDKDGLLDAAIQNFSCEFRNKLREKPFAAVASLLYDHIHNFNEAEVNAFSQLLLGKELGVTTETPEEIKNIDIALALTTVRSKY